MSILYLKNAFSIRAKPKIKYLLFTEYNIPYLQNRVYRFIFI